MLAQEGVLYHSAQDVELGMRGPVNWASRTARVETTVNTVQEGHRAIMDAIMEKKTKAREPGHPQGLRGAIQPSASTCNVDNWMQGLEEGASNREVGRTDAVQAH